ncbi:MAG: DUF2088 domain-containing protein [Roseibacillus sp.]|nr:DUF2088 domain-containing protein [Roseibacillus sp.]|tara:strand:+ start:1302 stop:2525 length:1224 start_codon:yes stop_codon:yes gene_type:complete
MEVHQVHQKLISNPLTDLESRVYREMDSLGLPPPGGEVAITAGSRGIDNIVAITRAAGNWLRKNGAIPFLAPCMGSHNGATSEGQLAMVRSLGLTEEATGMEIRSSMEVVQIGEVETGKVWMDRHCFEASGVLVLNRIKLHTCFSGPVQSGLTKMMVVGMGKIKSAETFHSAPTPTMKDMLLEMGECVINSGKIYGGLALLEDGFDRTAEVHAVRPEDILNREPALLERHRSYFPSLPVDELNVLIVSEIGKTFSGTGMDTNVIGYRGVNGYEDLIRPRIQAIGALALSPASQGNAIGVGLADFITRRLRDSIDEQKTFTNVFTTGDMRRMAIPCTLKDEQEVVRRMSERYGEQRWMFIPNTLHLETLFVSSDLARELADNENCEVRPDTITLDFDSEGRHRLKFHH